MVIINQRLKVGIIIVLGLIIACLGISLVYRLILTEPASAVNATVGTTNFDQSIEVGSPTDEDFFADYRLSRDRVRSKELDMLKAIVNDPASLPKAREAAYVKMVNMADQEEKEMQAETLIKAQGYQECAVVISPTTTTVVLGANTPSVNQQDIKKAVGVVSGSTQPSIAVIKIQN